MNTGELFHKPGASGYAKNRALILANPISRPKLQWSQKQITRNCPECSKMCYHSNAFENHWCTHCPVHGSPLSSVCPDCRRSWPNLSRDPRSSCTTCGVDISLEALADAGAFSPLDQNYEILERLQELDIEQVVDYLSFDQPQHQCQPVSSQRVDPERSASFPLLLKTLFPDVWGDISESILEKFTTAGIDAKTIIYRKARSKECYVELKDSLYDLKQSVFAMLSAIVGILCFCDRHTAIYNLLHGEFTLCPHCAALASWSDKFGGKDIFENYGENLIKGLKEFLPSIQPQTGEYGFEIIGRYHMFDVTAETLAAIYLADLLSMYEWLLAGYFRSWNHERRYEHEISAPANQMPRHCSSRSLVGLYVLKDDSLALSMPAHLSDAGSFEKFLIDNYSHQ